MRSTFGKIGSSPANKENQQKCDSQKLHQNDKVETEPILNKRCTAICLIEVISYLFSSFVFQRNCCY